MKAILMSIRPEYLVNILNGKKTRELRTRIPKGFKGWIYFCCTKGNWNKDRVIDFDKFAYVEKENRFHFVDLNKSPIAFAFRPFLNGLIPCRFWFENYDKIVWYDGQGYAESEYVAMENNSEELAWLVDSAYVNMLCLDYQDVIDYGFNEKNNKQKGLFALHIKNLEIFDKPKELSEFKHYSDDFLVPITRPPQSWMYVEVEE